MTSMDSNSKDKAPKSFFQQQDEAKLRLSLQEFEAQVPTEEIAREDVKAWLEKENLLFCHGCNSHNLEKKHGARVLKCLDCRRQTWITAGTFFHHAKRVKPRLAVLWLMERGFIISSSKLHKLTDLAQSSAFNILKRVALVIETYMEGNICEIPSAVFSRVICKRSRETPARAHPIAEQEEIDKLEQQAELQTQLVEKQQEELTAAEIASLPEHPPNLWHSSDPNITNSDITNLTGVNDSVDIPNSAITNLTGVNDSVDIPNSAITNIAGVNDSVDIPNSAITNIAGVNDSADIPNSAITNIAGVNDSVDITNSAITNIAGVNDSADITNSARITNSAKAAHSAQNTGLISHQTNTNAPDSTYNQLSQQEKTIYDLLSENPISFEEIYERSNMSVSEATATLVIMEIAGLVSSLPGNRYIRCTSNKNSRDTAKNTANKDIPAAFEAIALAVGNFIRNSFHGVSRKYLQNYLSTYWYHIDKNFWQTNSLLSACFRFGPVKLTEIMSYITPPSIKYYEG